MGGKLTGYQGINGSYSSYACTILTPSNTHVGFTTFHDCFHALKKGTVDSLVIPIENSTAGRVSDVHSLFINYPFFINAEFVLPINHALLGVNGAELSSIKRILSHEQAIMQCEIKIQEILPNATCEKVYDTAAAAQMVATSNDPTIAAISAPHCAELYDLQTLHSDIITQKDNCTTFVLLEKTQIIPALDDKNYLSSAIIEIPNQKGSLHHILGIFHKYDIDLTRIESYIKGGLASYSANFFITFKGHIQSPNVAKAVQEIKQYAKNIRIAGCFLADSKRNQNPQS